MPSSIYPSSTTETETMSSLSENLSYLSESHSDDASSLPLTQNQYDTYSRVGKKREGENYNGGNLQASSRGADYSPNSNRSSTAPSGKLSSHMGETKPSHAKRTKTSTASATDSPSSKNDKKKSPAPMTYHLLPSVFGPSRPATVVFSMAQKSSSHTTETLEDELPLLQNPALPGHPSANALRKVTIKSQSKRKDEGLYYCMPPSAVEFNVIKNAFKRAGFKRTKKFSQFNMVWGKHMKYDDYSKLNENQRCNHFPGSWALGRKDNLHKHLTVQRRKHGSRAYDFFPHSYLLPEDRALLQQDMEENPQNLYILKPRASSCGRGIKVIQRMDQIKRKQCLIQRYIADPFLIEGKKWDLRIYVVATSMDPLVVYMFDDGLVRFATEKYNKKKLSNRFIHLTNYSINKNSKKFDKNEDSSKNMTGSKWSIKALKEYFKQQGIDDRRLWKQVKDLIIKTMVAVESQINSLVKRHVLTKNNPCYEVFGFDVLVDADLKPWIIEVNVSPSLSSSSPLDKQIKGDLITQTFHMLGCSPYKRKEYRTTQEQERRDRLLGLAPANNLHTLRSSIYKRTLFELQRSNHLDFLTEDDRDMVMHFEEEYSRRGDFERIYPTKDTEAKYGKYFDAERYNNVLLSMWLQESRSRQQMLLESGPGSGIPSRVSSPSNGKRSSRKLSSRKKKVSSAPSSRRSKSVTKYRSSGRSQSRLGVLATSTLNF